MGDEFDYQTDPAIMAAEQDELEQYAEICFNCGMYASYDQKICPTCGLDRSRLMRSSDLTYDKLYWHEYPAERNKKGDLLPPYDEAIISYWMVPECDVHPIDLHVTVRRYPRSVIVSYSYRREKWSGIEYTHTDDGELVYPESVDAKVFKQWLKTDRADFEKLFLMYMAELSAELWQAVRE